MKIEIIIECSDDDEVLQHLSVIRSKLKKELAKNDYGSDIAFSDSNCYGTHDVKLTNL